MKIKLNQFLAPLLFATILITSIIPTQVFALETTDNNELDQWQYSVEQETSYQWEDSYSVTLSITNTSPFDIVDWTLSFSHPSELIRLGNAQIIYQDAPSYTLGCLATSDIIKSQQTIKVGLHIKGNSVIDLSNFELRGNIQEQVSEAAVSISNPDLTYQESADGSFYTLFNDLEVLSGELTNLSGITSLSYRIVDEYDNLVTEGTLLPTDKWSITNLGLHVGFNKIEFLGEDSNGSFSGNCVIINFNYNNFSFL